MIKINDSSLCILLIFLILLRLYSSIAEDNGLTGTIPSEIGNLKNLLELNLSKNFQRSSYLFYFVYTL